MKLYCTCTSTSSPSYSSGMLLFKSTTHDCTASTDGCGDGALLLVISFGNVVSDGSFGNGFRGFGDLGGIQSTASVDKGAAGRGDVGGGVRAELDERRFFSTSAVADAVADTVSSFLLFLVMVNGDGFVSCLFSCSAF